MTFDASKPDANESPASFPAQAQANWSRLETMISANHIFNAGVDASDGKHKFVVMPDQATAPSTAANEIATYSKAVSTVSELFLRREGDGDEIQMTAGAVSNTTNGYTFLPGGVLLQWNTLTATGAANTLVTFPRAFSATPYSVVVQMNRDSTTNVDVLYVNNLTSNNFYISNTSTTNRTVYYIAIGPS